MGFVLFQVYINAVGEAIHQPIQFGSRKFSKPAFNWDVPKKEAYGMFFGVTSCAYYLRGKEFLVETDHRNLQWIEMNQSPIVIRWRIALQSFQFKIRHITRKINLVADWQASANMRELLDAGDVALKALVDDTRPELSVAEILAKVHGGRNLHYGVAETWSRLKAQFPTAKITQE